MRFCTRKYRSPYRTGSLTAAARELSRYKLDLLGMQEVRWDFGARYEKGTIAFCTEEETTIIN